jgi:HJR/Mrr/RecB family endonuclease
MWSGSYSRTGNATKTNTVLACTNPVTLDYVSCRDVISPYASWLNPDQNNNTRKQIMGCNSQGIGTIDPSMFEIVTFDFNHPTTTRLDINQKVRDFKAGTATQQDVKDVVSQYMQGQ